MATLLDSVVLQRIYRNPLYPGELIHRSTGISSELKSKIFSCCYPETYLLKANVTKMYPSLFKANIPFDTFVSIKNATIQT